MLNRVLLALIAVAALALLAWRLCSHMPPTPHYEARVIDPDYHNALIEPGTGDYLLYGSDGVISRSEQGRVWQQMHSPTTQDINAMASNADGSLLVAVGAAGTILFSTDHGHHWSGPETAAPAVNLTSVLYLTGSNSWLAAGHDGTILRAENTAQTWTPITSGTTDHILALFAIPNTERLLLGGERGLLGMSLDEGRSWRVTQAGTERPIEHFRQINELTFGLSSSGKLVLTRDAGDSWQMLAVEQQVYFNDAAWDPNHNTIVLATSGGGILLSEDNARNWVFVPVTYEGNSHFIYRVLYDARRERLLALGHFGMVVQSTDGGNNWEDVYSGVGDAFKVVLHNEDKGQILAAGSRGFKALSEDNAASWQVAQPALDYYWRDGAYTRQETLIIAGALGKILRSTDSGQTWRFVQTPYPDENTPPSYRTLTYNEATSSLLAAGPTGLIMGSNDDGQSWQVRQHTPFDWGEAFTDIAIDPLRQTAIAVEAFKGPYFSPDAGNSWQRSSVTDERQFWHGTLLANKQHSLGLAVGQDGLLALGYEGGQRWEVLQPEALEATDLYGSWADNKNSMLYVFGAGGQLLRSADLGASWQRLATGTDKALRAMAREPKTRALLAIGAAGLILRSTDEGETWQLIGSTATDELRQILIEPGTNNSVLVGRSGTVLRSEDGGVHWQALDSHTQKHFRRAVFNQATGDLIALGERVVRFEKVK